MPLNQICPHKESMPAVWFENLSDAPILVVNDGGSLFTQNNHIVPPTVEFHPFRLCVFQPKPHRLKMEKHFYSSPKDQNTAWKLRRRPS